MATDAMAGPGNNDGDTVAAGWPPPAALPVIGGQWSLIGSRVKSLRRLGLVCGVVALGVLSPGYAIPRRPALDALPRLVLWAWECPEDLRQIENDVGVAFLAQTITVSGERLTLHPRLQPLRVPMANPLVAVTRIEAERFVPVGLTREVVDAIAALIARTMTLPRVRGVQIDFDATLSERDAYRTLIHQVRTRLDPATPLSITALASWCVGDDWLNGLPVDEAIPMLFRMGPVNAPFQRMATSPASAAAACRRALGTSVDEPLAVRAGRRRVYVFNARPWTRATVLQARHAIQ
jgi:hypothetical protein